MSDSTQVQNQDVRNSALFAQLVIQQSNMAFMLMGHGPEGQEKHVEKDLEAASFFIDQLEMLQVKTRGNLTKQETDLLNQSLTTLRMAFVEVSQESGSKPSGEDTGGSRGESNAPQSPQESPAQPTSSDAGDKVKFSKKY